MAEFSYDYGMNKRKSFNQDYGNNQGGGGKFRKSGNFGDRSPSKGNNKSPFNRGNQGFNNKPFNRNNGRPSFNRGNKSPFNKQNGNQQNFRGPRKSWQNENNDNGKFIKEDVAVRNKNDESSEDEMNNSSISNQINDKKIYTSAINASEESDSSESEEEVATINTAQNDSELSESEEEVEVEKINKSEMNVNKSDDSESSEIEEECEINQKDSSKNESEGNNDDDSEASESEEKTDLNKMKVLPTLKNCPITDEQCNRTLYIKNLPLATNQFQEFFSRYGKIEFIRKQVTSGNVCICFEKQEDAVKAMEVNGLEYKDHVAIITRWSKTAYHFYKRDFTNAIYVGNLPAELKGITALHRMFRGCGTINDIVLFGGKGVAYIWLDSADAVEVALELNNRPVGNRQITVELVDLEIIKHAEEKAKQGKHNFNTAPRFAGKQNMQRTAWSGFL